MAQLVMQRRNMLAPERRGRQLAELRQEVLANNLAVRLAVDALQRTKTCSSRYRAASSATVGPPANFAGNGSGTGSSPALMRLIICAARRRA